MLMGLGRNGERERGGGRRERGGREIGREREREGETDRQTEREGGGEREREKSIQDSEICFISCLRINFFNGYISPESSACGCLLFVR